MFFLRHQVRNEVGKFKMDIKKFAALESNYVDSKKYYENLLTFKNAYELIQGSGYNSFKDFMIRLENDLRLIDVGHVTLKVDDNGLIQYQVNMQTYFQK